MIQIRKIEEHKMCYGTWVIKNMCYLKMIGVHLPAVDTLSSKVSTPDDISRITSRYYLRQQCDKFYLVLENLKKKIKLIFHQYNNKKINERNCMSIVKLIEYKTLKTRCFSIRASCLTSFVFFSSMFHLIYMFCLQVIFECLRYKKHLKHNILTYSFTRFVPR